MELDKNFLFTILQNKHKIQISKILKSFLYEQNTLKRRVICEMQQREMTVECRRMGGHPIAGKQRRISHTFQGSSRR